MTGREGTLVGPYRLTRLLGSGGAGDVYLAEGPAQGGRPGIAAVKVLRGESGDPTATAMLRQAQAIAQLHQPHVLPIYQAAQHGPAVYIAMTYAPGGSLGATVGGAHGSNTLVRLPLGVGVVARLVNQVARALQSLHDRGIVHGDLKPNNLFVRTARQGGPMVAVADFGQTLVMRAATQAATAGSAWAAGALQCAAPEQLRGEDSPASDQYALATIAYLLLTGAYPFTGDARGLGEAILAATPPPPSRLDPTLSPGAEAALLRALAKAPQARFPDIATFAQALDDGLAAGASVMSGTTQEFAALGGSARGATPPPPRYPGSFSASDSRQNQGRGALTTAPSYGGGPGRSYGAAGRALPRRRGLTARQRLGAVIGGALIVALALVGAYGLTVLLNGPGAQGRLPNFGGLNYAPTITPNAAALARNAATAHAAEAQLAAATAAKPVFSDNLANNAQRWPVDGKSTFFAADGRLHLFNHDAHAVLSLDQPVNAAADFAVSVTLTFLQGGSSDLAGLRVRVTPVSGRQYAHITALIAPDGRYEIWRYSGTGWTVLDFGYTQTIVRGIGQSNTLSVLAQGTSILVFVNQHYVATVGDARGATAAAAFTMGPTVVYAGTEVAYSHYVVYPVGG